MRVIDYSLGYDLNGEHHGLGVGLSQPPDRFTVRKHHDDGTYTETAYVPKKICKMQRLKRDNYTDEFECQTCYGHTFTPVYTRPEFCCHCGAEVIDGN